MFVLGLFFRSLCILGMAICCALSTLLMTALTRCCRRR